MALLSQGLPVEVESVSNVTLTNSVNLGEVRFVNGEEYVYVYNAGGASITVGYCAVMSANTGFSVTVTSVSGYDYPIGFVKHATIVTAGYGWLLTRGFTTVRNGMASTALVQGDPLIVAANGAVQAYAVSTTAICGITGAFAQAPIGVVLQATGSAGAGYAYVRCFGT